LIFPRIPFLLHIIKYSFISFPRFSPIRRLPYPASGADVEAVVDVHCHDVREAEGNRSQFDIRAFLGVESGLKRGAFPEVVDKVPLPHYETVLYQILHLSDQQSRCGHPDFLKVSPITSPAEILQIGYRRIMLGGKLFDAEVDAFPVSNSCSSSLFVCSHPISFTENVCSNRSFRRMYIEKLRAIWSSVRILSAEFGLDRSK
jgi:hypothetical protein